jgi:hypothetical protein
MSAHDLDPNYFLPLWRSLVSYFRRYQPLVSGYGADMSTNPPLVSRPASASLPSRSPHAASPLVQAELLPKRADARRVRS